jgi:flagellar hook-associated protein 2
MADATYTSGSINFAGLGNGTDFNALIDKLVEVEQTRVTRLETWKSSWKTKRDQFSTLSTQMLSLKTTLESIDTVDEFLTKTVTSTDTDRLTATASSGAQATNLTIEIGQLASNDVLITKSGLSYAWESITDNDTSFTFSYAGQTYTINDIPGGTSLTGFVNLINNHADSRNRIRASTVFDGTTYHLQLSGLKQGSQYQVIISNAGNLKFGSDDFYQSQQAGNSKVRVNGFPSAGGGWIERSSNSINDIVEGITLNLHDAEVGREINLTTVTDSSKMREHIEKFINAVNTVRTQIQAITAVDSDGNGSILTGNYGVDIIGQKLKNITADTGKGFTYWDEDSQSGDRFSALSQLGILTDAEQGSETYGLLKIDEEYFQKALDENDPEAIARLFSADYLGESQTPDFTYTSLVEGTTQPGVYDVEVVSDGTKIISATINGEKAKISGWEITGQTGDALGMAIRLDNTTAGTHSGKISIKQGKTNEMIEELTELTKPYNKYTYEGGPLAVLQDNYKDIMDNIDDKIAFETTRINKMESNLKLKFSRLDALLGQYDLLQTQLDSSIAQLTSS